MRRFYLQDQDGQRQGLNGEDGIRLGDPTGLGVNFSTSFMDLGEDHFRVSERKVQQGQVVCTLTFVRAAYRRYRSFCDWCAAAEELYLVYMPYGEQEFLRRVEIEYLTKTELGHGKWLSVPAAFKCLTPWYQATPTELALTVRTGPRKRYSFRYTEGLRYGGESAGDMSAQIAPSGHLPSGLVLRYHGAIAEPSIRLTGLRSGKLYGLCALGTSLGASDSLELSTRKGDCHVHKIAADGTRTDLLEYVDLAHDPYPRAPVSEPSVIRIESAAAIAGSASLLVYSYYRTV